MFVGCEIVSRSAAFPDSGAGGAAACGAATAAVSQKRSGVRRVGDPEDRTRRLFVASRSYCGWEAPSSGSGVRRAARGRCRHARAAPRCEEPTGKGGGQRKRMRTTGKRVVRRAQNVVGFHAGGGDRTRKGRSPRDFKSTNTRRHQHPPKLARAPITSYDNDLCAASLPTAGKPISPLTATDIHSSFTARRSVSIQ